MTSLPPHSKSLPIMIGTLLVAHAANAQLWTSGHGDIGVALHDEGSGPEFHLHTHLHSGAVVDGSPLAADEEYDAGSITINVPLITKTSAPSDPALTAGTGAASGEDLWVLPQNNPGSDPIPFLGIATEELEPADWSSDITFTLGTVTSPSGTGDFSIWQPDGVGGFDFSFSTENGSNTFDQAAGVHDHFNYGFTEAGTWQVEITASGTHLTEGSLTDTQTFSFNVVPEPSSFAALAGMAALGFAAARRRHS
ncbi:MAG: choice-of-anchor M domain-containing protein [Opitutales bacterium]